jgi:hypothetical protein
MHTVPAAAYMCELCSELCCHIISVVVPGRYITQHAALEVLVANCFVVAVALLQLLQHQHVVSCNLSSPYKLQAQPFDNRNRGAM